MAPQEAWWPATSFPTWQPLAQAAASEEGAQQGGVGGLLDPLSVFKPLSTKVKGGEEPRGLAPQQQSWWPARKGHGAARMGQRFLKRGVVGQRQQSLKDFGIPWASPVAQGYPGAEVMGGPYVPTEFTEDALETEDEKKLSSEGRWPYVKYYGQPNSIDGNPDDLDPRWYNYLDGFEGSEYDNLPTAYNDFLDEFD
jgi:hypothetical protein